MKKITLIVVVTSIFIRCATLPSKTIPTNYDVNSSNGLVIGAITFDKKAKNIYNSYSFYYSKVGGVEYDSPKKNKIKINPEQTYWMQFKPDFFEDNKAVYYFSVDREDGDYEFYAISLFENGVSYSQSQIIRIKIPFSVKKGKVKYLGEIYLNQDNKLEFSNKSERDLPKINELFPTLMIEK
jgi:hypothetical protein